MAIQNTHSASVNKALSVLPWQCPSAFIKPWKIELLHIDHYQHVNNVAYISRQEELAWEHSSALGLSLDLYFKYDRGMVIHQHAIKYHAPAHLGDTLLCGTWISSCDKKFRLTRQFQFICQQRQKTVFTATTDFVCIALSSGLPRAMPSLYAKTYGENVVKCIPK